MENSENQEQHYSLERYNHRGFSIRQHWNYNGSGVSAFGGQTKWPTITVKARFISGEEEQAEKLAAATKVFIEQWMKENTPPPIWMINDLGESEFRVLFLIAHGIINKIQHIYMIKDILKTLKGEKLITHDEDILITDEGLEMLETLKEKNPTFYDHLEVVKADHALRNKTD
jgi:hypothetical protein